MPEGADPARYIGGLPREDQIAFARALSSGDPQAIELLFGDRLRPGELGSGLLTREAAALTRAARAGRKALDLYLGAEPGSAAMKAADWLASRSGRLQVRTQGIKPLTFKGNVVDESQLETGETYWHPVRGRVRYLGDGKIEVLGPQVP